MNSSKIFTAATLFILAASNVPFRWLERPASAKVSDATTSLNRSSSPLKRFRALATSVTSGPARLLPGSYYNLSDNMTTSLILNNKGPEPLDVQPTLFSLDGVRLDVPSVTVNGTSFHTIDLRDWVVAGAGFDQGSLQLVHYGMDMQLGAQIKMLDEEHSLIFDEQLMANMAMSSRLEGVWWLRSHECNIRLVLSNTSDFTVVSSVLISQPSPAEQVGSAIELAPHQTRIISSETFLKKGKGVLRKIGGISISHNGPAGALLARGFIDEPSSGYSSLIEFSDPAMAHSSKLNGGGLRLIATQGQKLAPIVIARNVGITDSTVNGTLPYTAADGNTSAIQLPEIHLAPGEIDTIDVARVIKSARLNVAQIKSAGLEFSYSSSPGSVVIDAQSISSDGNQVFRLPLVDANAQPSSTGGYPWNLEGTSSTFVYITNVTDNPQHYVLQLNFEGGVYAPGLRTIEPHETATIDVRLLRDGQVKDEHNQTIPLAASRGQIQWSIEGPENLTLIGRAEQSDAVKGMSSSYACVNCCPASCAETWVNPGGVTGFIGDTTQFTAMQQNQDCFGNPMTPFSRSASWSSSSPNIASVSGGFATALSVGNTNIGAGWTAFLWDSNPNNTCTKTIINPFASATCDVLPRVTIVFNGSGIPLKNGSPPPGSWPQYVNSVTMHADTDFAGGSYAWSTTSNKVMLTNTTSSTVTITSVSESATADDVPIKVTYTVGDQSPVSAERAITVQKPSSLKFDSYGAANNDPETCTAPTAGKKKDILWQLQDQFSHDIKFSIPGSDDMTINTGQNGCALTLAGTLPSEMKYTHADGKWNHHYHFCTGLCQCTTVGVQKYKFNGFQVDLPYTFTCTGITVNGK